MKQTILFSLHNKFALLLLTLMVTFAGIYAGTTMKLESIPNINVPIVTLTTIYPGAAPETVAEDITLPLERRLKSMNGVSTYTSTSADNVSSILVEFAYDRDMDEAEREIRDMAAAMPKPNGAGETDVSRFNINDIPIVTLSIASERLNLEQLSELADKQLLPELSGVEGAARVQASGLLRREATVTLIPDQLKQLGLTPETVTGVIQGSTAKLPLGLFELGAKEASIVVDGQLQTLDQLKALRIPVVPQGAGFGAAAAGAAGTGVKPSGGPAALAALPTVTLDQIAEIALVEQRDSISRTNGQPSIGVTITKTTDANTVAVVNQVKQIAEDMQERHTGLRVTILNDQGKPIEESVHTMVSKAIFGAGFAILVILLFLRNIRTTLISVVSIPLSLLIALLVLKEMDISLNIMTLGAMTVAIGRVVDDSIVVIENNYRRLSLQTEALRGKELIVDATKEMFMPIFSSTLVTVAVFLPLGLVSGPVGQLFMPFALTMVFALLASLLVAVTVVPMLAHVFLSGSGRRKAHREEKPGKLSLWYQHALRWSLNHKWTAFGGSSLLLAGSLLLLPAIGFSFLPEEEQSSLTITYTPPAGALLEQTEQVALKTEQMLLSRKNVNGVQYSIGSASPYGAAAGGGGKSSAVFQIQYDEDSEQLAWEKEDMLQDVKHIDPAGVWKQLDSSGGIGGNTLQLFIYGDRMEDIRTAADQVLEELRRREEDFQQPKSSLSQTLPQYTFRVDSSSLSGYGLTAAQLAVSLRPALGRPQLSVLTTESGKQLPVYMQTEERTYKDISDLQNEIVPAPLGPVPLRNVVELVQGEAPSEVTRKDGQLYAQISASIEAKDVGKASSELGKALDKLKLPAGVTVDFGGVTEQMNDTFRQMGLAILAAVAIVYLLLVLFFGGALTPFAILFSLPFTVIGGLVALYAADETISASAMMGALMLIGIVVTNAIVLLDRVRWKEKEGLSVREALLEAAATRLRPILMTALATIGALLPLALGWESTSGSLISKGLGVTVIGGLVSSTLLTLIIVPIVYEALSPRRKLRRFRKLPLGDGASDVV
ncbi:efflux RND transporter permease subunit [Paenibacillus turpanensis]|uniref:efflux RND transporter permease subunit n=1 Tax=Paenibacillus turpanensis TaxID=2689078 RepID=UPI00140CB0BF|nr:efflux RND transporter permease subunit [Paenibacillus turpanensis]